MADTNAVHGVHPFVVDYLYRWDAESRVFVGYIPLIQKFTQSRTEEGLQRCVANLLITFNGVMLERGWPDTAARYEKFCADEEATRTEAAQVQELVEAARVVLGAYYAGLSAQSVLDAVLRLRAALQPWEGRNG